MLAVTALSSYLYCPRKLYLERVLKIVKPPKEVLVKGTIRHETYDLINKNEENIVKSIQSSDIKDILMIYKKNYSKLLRTVIIRNKSKLESVELDLSEIFRNTWRYIYSEAKSRSFNIYDFIDKKHVLGEKLWILLTPKITSEKWMESPKLKLRGIVDQIQEYENRIVPVELKTGRAPQRGVWPGHKIQMGAYMMMLKESGENLDHGYVRYLDTEESRSIMMNEFLSEEVLSIREETEKVLASQKLPRIVENRNKCKSCELREKCYKMDSEPGFPH